MTLTMTLAANGLLVQSADHRLSRLDGTLYNDAAPKQMWIQGLGNQASVVCYAGVGVVSGRGSASDLLYRTTSDLGTRASFDEVAAAIRDAGTGWLNNVAGDRRHSFTLAGFEALPDEGRIDLRVAVISNWQQVGGVRGGRVQTQDSPVAADVFTITEVDDDGDGGHPVLLVTGLHGAVHDGEAHRLTRLVRDRRKLQEVARVMATTNRTAAGRMPGISPNCTTVSLMLGRTQINGGSRAHNQGQEREVTLDNVITGSDIRRVLEEAVAEMRQREGITGPLRRSTFSFAMSLPFTTAGSPFAHPNEPLLR